MKSLYSALAQGGELVVEAAHRGLRRSLAAAGKTRRPVDGAGTALWPRDRATTMRVGLGMTTLMALLGTITLILGSFHSALAASPPGTGGKAEEGASAAPLPDDPADPTPTSGLTQILDLDLRTDPRKDCQVQGPVAWEPGRLTLGPDGSIRRNLNVGAQVKLNLRLSFAQLQDDSQPSTTRFSFPIRDRGAFVVKILRRREGGKTRAQIQLIEEDTPDPGEKPPTHTRVLHTSAWRDDVPDALWTFQHHYGLQMVSAGTERLAIGYSDKEPRGEFWKYTPTTDRSFFENCAVHEPLEVSGWGLEQKGMAVSCLEVSGSASASYRNAAAQVLGVHNNAADLSFDLRQRINIPFYGMQSRLSQGDGRDIKRVESYDSQLSTR